MNLDTKISCEQSFKTISVEDIYLVERVQCKRSMHIKALVTLFGVKQRNHSHSTWRLVGIVAVKENINVLNFGNLR